MAKTASTKKREHSVHSRAAKRGASPPPKELVAKTKTKAPVGESDYKPWIHSTQDAGVSKKKNKKQLSHGQLKRKQKGIEQADRNQDKLEKKVADSKTRGKRIQARAVEWEELNERVNGRKPAEGKTVAAEIARMGELEREAEEDGSKLAEGVQMLDVRQTPPGRVAEGAAQAMDILEGGEMPDANQLSGPVADETARALNEATGPKADEIDDIS